jgi:hypothetical protein
LFTLDKVSEAEAFFEEKTKTLTEREASAISMLISLKRGDLAVVVDFFERASHINPWITCAKSHFPLTRHLKQVLRQQEEAERAADEKKEKSS